MTGRETVALWFLLPPLDHLPSVCADDPGVVLHQHPAQHIHGRQLAQPARRGAVPDRFQQRVPVPGIGDRQFPAPRLRGRRLPGGHRGAVAAGPVRHADPPGQPVRVCGRQRLQCGPHAFPGQFQPAQRRHRRDHVGGIGALFPGRLDQAFGGQPGQQHVQRYLLQVVRGDPVPELGQHRVIKPRVIQRQPQQVLPVDPGPDRISRSPVGQVLRPLQDRHQRQPRRRQPRLAPDAERGREIVIGQPLAQSVTDHHGQRPLCLPGPVHPRDRRPDLRIRIWPRDRLHAHDIPDSAAATRGQKGQQRRPRARS